MVVGDSKGNRMGLVKTRRLVAMHPPSPAATEDKEAGARKGGAEIPSVESHPVPSLPPPATPAFCKVRW